MMEKAKRGRPRKKAAQADQWPFAASFSFTFDLPDEHGAAMDAIPVVAKFQARRVLDTPLMTEARAQDGGDPWSDPTDVNSLSTEAGIRALVAQSIVAQRGDIERDGTKLLHAMAFALSYRLDIPDWMSKQFLSRLYSTSDPSTRTLDAAFSHKPKTARGLNAQERHERLLEPIISSLVGILENDVDCPLDSLAWEQVGSEVGESPSTCQKIYQEGVRSQALYNIDNLRKVAGRNKLRE